MRCPFLSICHFAVAVPLLFFSKSQLYAHAVCPRDNEAEENVIGDEGQDKAMQESVATKCTWLILLWRPYVWKRPGLNPTDRLLYERAYLYIKYLRFMSLYVSHLTMVDRRNLGIVSLIPNRS